MSRGLGDVYKRQLATRLGHWPEMAAVALVLLALAGAAPMRRRRLRAAAQERIAEER